MIRFTNLFLVDNNLYKVSSKKIMAIQWNKVSIMEEGDNKALKTNDSCTFPYCAQTYDI